VANSQNGWPASSNKRTISVELFKVAGVEFVGGVKAGDVADVLGYVLMRVHLEVEKLVPGWCWGWAYRAVRAGSSLSNHASGTAVDVNAPVHPLGKRGTFSPQQRDRIRDVLSDVDGVVRWGGNYNGRPDEMHFEINAGPAAVAVVAARLRRPALTPIEENDMANVELLHSDSDQRTPGGKYRWGDFVFMVKYDPELPGGAVRSYLPAGFVHSRVAALVGHATEVPDASLAAILVAPGGGIPQDLIDARPS
jgi:hypothetical protein